jgi:hypothetical protein
MSIDYKSSHPKWVPYSILGLLLIELFGSCSILAQIGQKTQVERIAYVQNSVTGKVDQVEAVEPFKVSPSNVVRFSKQWKVATFSWSGKNPDRTPDTGSVIAGTTVPTPFFKGMQFVQPPFRDEYAIASAKAYEKTAPLSGFISSGKYVGRIEESSVKVTQVYDKGNGKWQVYLVSRRSLKSPMEPNRIVYEPKAEVLELEVILPHTESWEPKESPYAKVFKEMEDQRLMITNIKEIPLQN